MTLSGYQAYQKIIIRTPAYPLQREKLSVNSPENFIKTLKKDSYFTEALYLASPELHRLFINLDPKTINLNKPDKLFQTLLKYYIRIRSRATPFGLFAGLSLLKPADETKIELAENFSRHTRLDMNYLVSLAHDLARLPEIRKHMNYYVNNSLYLVGNEIRYVEYYYENTVRIHESISIESNEYIMKVIQKAQNGARIDELTLSIMEPDITREEAENFVLELIDNQILVSKLEPSVTGNELIDQLIKKLKNKAVNQQYVSLLEKISNKLKEIDLNFNNKLSDYQEVKKTLRAFETTYDEKYLFQTDLSLITQENSLNRLIIDEIHETIDFLLLINNRTPNKNLQDFGKKLYERYEEQTVPLSIALDSELGIPLETAIGSQIISPLLDGLKFPEKKDSNEKIHLTPVQKILLKKLKKASNEQLLQINLNRKDFADIQTPQGEIPDSFSVLLQLINQDGQIKPYIVNTGGSTAGSLIARFGYLNHELKDYLHEIAQTEAQLQPDKIIAEIVHLPEARAGNILMRPQFRDYEIPYLAQSSLPIENQISINDLYLKAKPDGSLLLFSKKHQKEVIPKLTNAHNFHANALPVYHFLALYQSQNQISNWTFSWGSLEKLFDFLPRVNYKNSILSPAKWKITQDEIKKLKNIKNKKELISKTASWRQKRNIPQWILLPEGDNKLLLNLDNYYHLELWQQETKKQKEFWIEEFLHTGKTPVSNGKDFFTNEIIIGFHKEIKEI